MSFEAYSYYDMKEAIENGRWYGRSEGIEDGRAKERKTTLGMFADNNLFGVTANKNKSAFFQNGIKLDYKDREIILKVCKNG